MDFIYDTLEIGGAIEDKTDSKRVETKLEIPSSRIKKVLSIASNSYAIVKNNEGTYLGKVNFYICFIDNDGIVQKCETSCEFFGEYAKDLQIKELTCTNSKAEINLDGEYPSLYVTVLVRYKPIKTEKVNCLTSGEDLIINKVAIETKTSFLPIVGNQKIDDTFTLNYAINKVLYQKAISKITMVTCGVGAVIVDGEIKLSLILLQNSENNAIIKEEKIIPFSFECENQDVLPNFDASILANIKSIKTDVAVDENDNSSDVNVTVGLGYELSIVKTENKDVVIDAFSTHKEIDLEFVTAEYKSPCAINIENSEVLAMANAINLGENKQNVIAFNEEIIITNKELKENGLEVEGIVSFDYLVLDDENYVVGKTEAPFTTVLGGFTANGDYVITPYVSNLRINNSGLDQLKVEFTASFVIEPYKTTKYTFVKEVKELGEKKEETCGISVYIALPNEELWSLSKRLNENPESLKEANKELQFPLLGTERIVVFRKK